MTTLNRILCCLLAATMIHGAQSMGLVSTEGSPHARWQAIDLGGVRWTDGFWAQRHESLRTDIVPGMWRLMSGTSHTHYLENFRIAAGLAEGRSRGAPFNDGDFYKWLEAATIVYGETKDPELEGWINNSIELIAKAQRQDGYIHTKVLIPARQGVASAVPFQSRHNFEMYNMGHLFTTACVHHRVTGRTDLLAVATKAADFLAATFDGSSPEAARSSVCPSHYMGIVELYRETGERRYLDLAKRFFEMRDQITDGGDDNQDRIPFTEQREAIGHAVRANYLYAGATDLFMETGDASLRKPLDPIWQNLVTRKMYITGGCGALYDGASPDGSKNQSTITRTHQAYGRDFQLPNTTAHNETCAAIGNVLWNWRMFLATGHGRYMDVAELALHNSVLSGVSLGGTNFFYTNPLRVTDPMPVNLRWSRERVPFVSAFCCPPNVARILAAAPSLAYARNDDSISVNLYGASTLDTNLGDTQRIRLRQETAFPWNGRIRILVERSSAQPFAIRLRIPGWSQRFEVRLNSLPSPTPEVVDGYIELRREWNSGDLIELDLAMKPHLVESNPLVEETLNQLAIRRGPIVYCLESADLPDDTRIADVAISSDADLIARFDRGMLEGVVTIDTSVRVRTPSDWSDTLYREHQPDDWKTVKARFVPYFAWGNRGRGEMSVWLPRF